MSLELDFDLPDLQFDENQSPTELVDTTVTTLEKSILRPSNIDNLIKLNTPIQKHLKVSFAPTPARPTPAKPATPAVRYNVIRVLDEEENWVERTSILTKQDHLEYLECAQQILEQLIADCIPRQEERSVASDKPEVSETLTHSEELKVEETELPVDSDKPLIEKEETVQLPDDINLEKPADLEIPEPLENSIVDETPEVRVDMSDSPPLPAKGAYTIDWDNFDDTMDPFGSGGVNPFGTGKGIQNSPPRSDPMEMPIKPAPVDHNENTNTVTPDSPVKPSPVKKSPKKKKTKSSPSKKVPKEVEVSEHASSSPVDIPDSSNHEVPVETSTLTDDISQPEPHVAEEPVGDVVADDISQPDAPVRDAVAQDVSQPEPDCIGLPVGDMGVPVGEAVAPEGELVAEDVSKPIKFSLESDSEDSVPFDSGIEFECPVQQIKTETQFGAGDAPEIDTQGLSDGFAMEEKDVKQEENYDTAEEDIEDEFKPATEDMFGDAADFDMLEKFGRGDGKEPSNLARQSLYVKFDPLVGQTHQPAAIPPPAQVPSSLLKTLETLRESDDLLMMNTPEKSDPRNVGDRDFGNKTIDRLFDLSPLPQDSVGGLERESSNLMTSATEEIVKVCKYSDADLEQLRKNLELDFQSRILAKERNWDKKLRERETQLAVQKDQIDVLTKSNVDMKKIVAEYEKTISQLIADSERSSSNSQHSLTDLVKEKDQALADLNSVENAFSDLHRRYEKLKEAVEGFKKNEDTLKRCVEDHQGRIKKWEQKYQLLKQHAEEKLDVANEQIDKVKKTTAADNARLQAALKKSELIIEGLEGSLEQKAKENRELAAICDELISKVGQDS